MTHRHAPLTVCALFALPLLFCLSVQADVQTRDPLREAVDLAVNKVKPALVRIHVVATSYREGREQKYEASGSGVIISKEGHVITNHHVAGDATRLSCTLSSREEIPAILIGYDAPTDIAIIKLMPEDGREFPFVEFGDSDKVRVGDNVMAMGSPLALSQSVTLGIVSNSEMIMPRRRFGRLTQNGEDVGALVRWIAHDAQIFPGNSGGPLVNTKGEIIGINEISIGLSGAIPGNLAKQVADAILRDGKVKRSWLGITIHPLLKHSGNKKGVLITHALEGSPADKGGIESGDILLRFAGVDITVRFEEEMPAFNRLIADLQIGSTYEALVLRDGEEKTLLVKTTERKRVRPKQHELKQWGITGRNLSYVMAKQLKRDTTDGFIVTSVQPGGAAGEAKPSIRRGDIIVRVGDTPIGNVDDLRKVTVKLTKDADEPVPALSAIERKSESFVTVVKVGIKELHDPALEVKKAWLPVSTQVITRDMAKLLGHGDLKGFRVTQVFAESSAEAAGLEVGDLIVALDGEPLTASALEDYEELPTLIRSYKVGSEAELAVLRDGERIKVAVELERAPKEQREMKKYRNNEFEFTVREIAFRDRASERWKKEKEGVIVDDVQSGGWAALGSLHVGDLIVEINGLPTDGIPAIKSAMEAVQSEQPASVVVRVLRGIYTEFLELEPRWDDR